MFDVAIVGAGVFGSWTAWHLRQRGQTVALVDAYGAANSRASSGGETRVIRLGYGPDRFYTRWAERSLPLWRDLSLRTGQPLFQPVGVLWLAGEEDDYTAQTLATLNSTSTRWKKFSAEELRESYPQISLSGVAWGLLEEESGALLARRSVQILVQEAQEKGAEYLKELVLPIPAASGSLGFVSTQSGRKIEARQFVFACGPWLPRLFPKLLKERLFITRQEVFFLGTPAGDNRFSPPALPAWIDLSRQVYGIPDLENRGFKIAPDLHGPAFDPDSGCRIITSEVLESVREYLGLRFPDLKEAPLVESRVCQYENTSNGDFLIDRHPDFDNIWLVGGGSGHGFKHGPALGEYVAARLTGESAELESRFSLAAKATIPQRTVF
ncbi:MAG: FAD-dependent oxidoreductase [Acidobacteriota bacterium]